MSKTPLQAAVMVICDCLCQLPPEDQGRALEAVRVTLGLNKPSAARPEWGPVETEMVPRRQALPRVEVQMVNDRPMVMNGGPAAPGDAGRRQLVIVGPQRVQQRRAMALPAPPADGPGEQPSQRRGGYVRPPR